METYSIKKSSVVIYTILIVVAVGVPLINFGITISNYTITGFSLTSFMFIAKYLIVETFLFIISSMFAQRLAVGIITFPFVIFPVLAFIQMITALLKLDFFTTIISLVFTLIYAVPLYLLLGLALTTVDDTQFQQSSSHWQRWFLSFKKHLIVWWKPIIGFAVFAALVFSVIEKK